MFLRYHVHKNGKTRKKYNASGHICCRGNSLPGSFLLGGLGTGLSLVVSMSLQDNQQRVQETNFDKHMAEVSAE